jgi:oligopeptide transport system substrate-binding protein
MPSMPRGRLGWPVAVFVSAALVAGACSKNSSTSTTGTTVAGSSTTVKGATRGGTLVDLQNFAQGDPDAIDPQLSSTIQGSQIGQLMWDMLTKTNFKTGKLEPDVALSWKSNATFTHWDFTLGTSKFSNGDPVLPSSFVYAWNRLASKAMASQVAYHITDNLKITGAGDVAKGTATTMSGLKADDASMTLSMDLDAPLSFLPNVVSHLAFAPEDVKVMSALSDQTKYQEGVMIGNGPYKEDAAGWRHNQDINLVRNDAYSPPPGYVGQYLDKITFVISKDLDSAFATFEAGQGDTGYIPQARFADVKAKYSPNIAADPSLGIYYWGFNMKDPVVGGPANVKLRQAIAEVIDKQAIIDKTYNGSRKVATGFTPPGVPGYKAGLDLFPTRDLTKAKSLLAEWEQATGKKAADLPPIRVQYGAGAGHSNNAQIIEQNMSELGIKTADDGMATKTYFTNLRKGQDDGGKTSQFFRSGWIWDYIAYDNGLFPLFDTGSLGGDNLELYSNKAFDDLITQARATAEGPARDALYQQAEGIVLNTDTITVPLNWYTGQIVYSPKVHNVVQSSLQFVAYDTIYKTP